ncbi:DUF5054 domain-containing protein [Paenibacillus sp. MAHUQ-46]|uniref:DUF5054 domain-containing protein n=1 Tax=Paenibacillus roseus TaxID=2798579 RepID=A0A934J3N8_9BACL|nr:DUF5054 domain-containing protein [Paenibacillus roseus]
MLLSVYVIVSLIVSVTIVSRKAGIRLSEIKKVHVIFKTHLDIGFTDLAHRVVDRYMNEFIPKAIELSERLDARGGEERFIWTTGSWLMDQALIQADAEGAKRAQKAMQEGRLAWHGLPFTLHTELLDESLFRYGMSIAARLDKKFGKKTISAKMTDVPGHTISMVPLLAESGIKYMHLGVNPTSKNPAVPLMFRWKVDGQEIIVHYAGNYGETFLLEGFEEALVFAHTGDNCGPPSVDGIVEQFESIRARFPGAQVVASTLDNYAESLWAHRHVLPVVTEEIGDTWIHGVGSDPLKTAQFRELSRLRKQWIEQGVLKKDSEAHEKFSNALLLVAEHTWGLDVKKFLPDFKHYSKEAFNEARERDIIPDEAVTDKYSYIGAFAMNEDDRLSAGLFASEGRINSYTQMERSWTEQREYMATALDVLPHELRKEAEARLKPLEVPQGEAKVLCAEQRFQWGGYEVAFGTDGSIVYLKDSKGKVWADADHRIASYVHELFGVENYDAWFRDYMENLIKTHPWADADFGKPGFEYAVPKPTHREYRPILDSLKLIGGDNNGTVVAELRMPQEAVSLYGVPSRLVLVYLQPEDSSELQIQLHTFGKQDCRLPEASWLSINVKVDNPNLWLLDKIGGWISPLRVVKDGNRNLHATDTGALYEGTDGTARVESLDSPLVSPGEPRLVRFDNTFADLDGGIHFNLHNNTWGTNFRMWFGEDMIYRYTVRLRANL